MSPVCKEIQRRDQQQADEHREEQPEHHAHGEGLEHLRALAQPERERRHADHRGERGHEDRPQSPPAGLDYAVAYRHAVQHQLNKLSFSQEQSMNALNLAGKPLTSLSICKLPYLCSVTSNWV